jgi:hypothetical protein
MTRSAFSVVGDGDWVVGATYETVSFQPYNGYFVSTSNGLSYSIDSRTYFFSAGYTATINGFRDLAGDTFLQYAATPPFGSLMQPWGTAPPSSSDVLVKLDTTGTEKWLIEVPANTGFHVDAATGSTYFVGSGAGDVGCGPGPGAGAWAAVVDTNDVCVWIRAAGTTASFVNGAAADYLVGTFTGTLDLGCGPMTSASAVAYAAKLGPTGACVWSRAFPVSQVSLLELPTGEPLITAPSAGSADLGCGAVAGASVMAKLDAAGACVWSRGFADTVTVSPFSAGDLVVSADYTGTIDLGCGPLASVGLQDLAVGRLDGATGACAWSKSFGAAGARVTGFGNATQWGYVVAWGNLGGTRGVDFGGGPISATGYVAELDGTGAFRYEQPFDGTTTLVALDPCGTVLLGSLCPTCGVGGAFGVTVTKLAP